MADNSRSGLALIKAQNPVAAVIDYHLPQMSGIEICRQVRKADEYRDTKLILFTSDNRPNTQAEAMAAGFDTVVVKSSNAGEVIDTVLQSLKSDPNLIAAL